MSTTAPASSTTAPEQVLLSPPWWSYQKMLRFTVGLTPGVTVSPLVSGTTGYVLNIVVPQGTTGAAPSRGTSLATLLAPHQQFGNVGLDVRVVDTHGTPYPALVISSPDQVVAALTQGFGGNPMFAQALIGRAYTGTQEVVAVFNPSVVQFWNDNLADFYSNTNMVAANAFSAALAADFGNGIKLTTTTVDEHHR